jgi:hypothetical protein
VVLLKAPTEQEVVAETFISATQKDRRYVFVFSAIGFESENT